LSCKVNITYNICAYTQFFRRKNWGGTEPRTFYHARKEDISVLGEIVKYAQARNYKIVTLTEFLKE